MRYSIKSKDYTYVKGQNLSSKYVQKLLDTTKKLAINALKTALKEANQSIVEGAGDLVWKKDYKKN